MGFTRLAFPWLRPEANRAVCHRLLLVLVVLLSASVTPVASAAIIILSSNVSAGASSTNGPGQVLLYQPTSIPESGTVTATDGLAMSETGFSLSDDGFTITFDHQRTSNFLSYASGQASVFFRSDRDTPYMLSGAYSSNDPEGRLTRLETLLTSPTGTDLFSNGQQSHSTPNESFVIGESGGDTRNSLTGSATGTLLAGRLYDFVAFAALEMFPIPGTAPAAGSGSITLSFVPEPSTGLLLSAGLLTLGIARRKRG